MKFNRMRVLNTPLLMSVMSIALAFGSLPAAAAPVAATAAPAAPAASSQDQAATRHLQLLGERYYAIQAEFEPLASTYNGDRLYDDKLPMTLNPAVHARYIRKIQLLQTELAGIPADRLSAADQINYACLQYDLKAILSMAHFRDRLMPLNQMDSVPVALAQFASGQSAQPLNTVADYQTFLRRLQALPGWLKLARANMQEGMKTGIVLPKALVVSLLPQFEQLASGDLAQHPYLQPIRNFPADFSAADQAKLSQAYQKALGTQILPALQSFNAFLKRDYLPAARSSTGWSALPGGTEWYRAWVADQTTTSLTPDQIHEIGLKEVARIQSEYARLGPQLGYQGPAEKLPEWMEQQTRYKPFKSEKEVLDAYRAIDAQVRKKLPELFGRMPKAPLDIRPEPEISRKTASDHYSAPAIDGSRPGVFWAVINDPADYATTGMKTLFLHEGQPGHHFHLATLQELEIPKFRKVDSNNAYTEGWALYAETLGRDMGLWDNDPASYYGHLSDEMLRATRLVVDTGMHAKGWTREQGIAYLQQTLGYSQAVSQQCIERYMAWPGQALGYKIGSLKIQELRHKAEAELGTGFDLRAFHDAILADGTLPLSLLESKMLKWIATQKAARMANK